MYPPAVIEVLDRWTADEYYHDAEGVERKRLAIVSEDIKILMAEINRQQIEITRLKTLLSECKCRKTNEPDQEGVTS